SSATTLPKLCRGLALYPQELVNVRVAKGFDWQKQPAVAKAKREAERALGNNGRVLLRPSGTEPVLRVMVEGKDDAEVRRLARMIAETVQEVA
ncbi:MAG TPA: phosphoglucosamine mutase, partial [Burkholderiales bacterium]|nr:phosphoglucosamine mutase [Burkholderiales bacterium]